MEKILVIEKEGCFELVRTGKYSYSIRVSNNNVLEPAAVVIYGVSGTDSRYTAKRTFAMLVEGWKKATSRL